MSIDLRNISAYYIYTQASTADVDVHALIHLHTWRFTDEIVFVYS